MQNRGACDWRAGALCVGVVAHVNAHVILCAVQRCRSSVGETPTRQLSFQPVAIGAVVEVTKLPKPLMERTVKRFREQAGRDVSER
jgi:ribose 1,5-bisphosphokinase PhnN